MQLRRWSVRSSIRSLISSVLSGRKALLMRGKGRSLGRAQMILQGPGPCYKVRLSVVSGANACTVLEKPYPVATELTLLRHGLRIRASEAAGLGCGDVGRGLGVRGIDAAEDDVVARVEARVLRRVEDPDLRQPGLERPPRGLGGSAPACVRGDRLEDDGEAVLARPGDDVV